MNYLKTRKQTNLRNSRTSARSDEQKRLEETRRSLVATAMATQNHTGYGRDTAVSATEDQARLIWRGHWLLRRPDPRISSPHVSFASTARARWPSSFGLSGQA